LANQTSLELRSLVKPDGSLELSLAHATVSPPKNDEVIVRIEATPINPSDLGLLLAGGDVSSAKVSGKGSQTVVTAPITPAVMRALPARIGKSMPVGLEGAGVVTNAGPSPEAQALLGKTVSIFVGGCTDNSGKRGPPTAWFCLPESSRKRQRPPLSIH
jgi:NADPH:quinone reductase